MLPMTMTLGGATPYCTEKQLMRPSLPFWALRVPRDREIMLRVALLAMIRTGKSIVVSEFHPYCSTKCRLIQLTTEYWVCPRSGNFHNCTPRGCRYIDERHGLLACKLTGLSHGSESVLSFTGSQQLGGLNPETGNLSRVDADTKLKQRIRTLRPVKRTTVESRRQVGNTLGFSKLAVSVILIVNALTKYKADVEKQEPPAPFKTQNTPEWVSAIIRLWFRVVDTKIFQANSFMYRFDFHVLVCLYRMHMGVSTTKGEQLIPVDIALFGKLPSTKVVPKALKRGMRGLSHKTLTDAMTFLARALQCL